MKYNIWLSREIVHTHQIGFSIALTNKLTNITKVNSASLQPFTQQTLILLAHISY